MTGIVIVFPKLEDGKSIRNLLVRHGYDIAAVCTRGSQAADYVDMMNDGIVICGYKAADMYYTELKSSLPKEFDVMLLASARVCQECTDPDIVCVSMPLKVHELVSTLEMMCMNQARRRKRLRSRPKQRSEEEKKILWQAKEVLMERNHMTEEDAHRYIQKCSMDSGTSLTETAQMILHLYE